MTNKRRVFAYYDGSNFYHCVLINYGIKDINFFHMTNQLLDQNHEQLVKIKYFNSPMNQQEDPAGYRKQQKFFEVLRKTPLVEMFLGRLAKRSLEKINIQCPSCGFQRAYSIECPKCRRHINVKNCFKSQEKGVDVKLATHLLLDAIDNKFDIALLFSGDADFCPAIKHIVQNLKKDVVFCHFPSPKTSELIQTCSETRLITKEMVENAQIGNIKEPVQKRLK